MFVDYAALVMIHQRRNQVAFWAGALLPAEATMPLAWSRASMASRDDVAMNACKACRRITVLDNIFPEIAS
jgi:hypothetical protein